MIIYSCINAINCPEEVTLATTVAANNGDMNSDIECSNNDDERLEEHHQHSLYSCAWMQQQVASQDQNPGVHNHGSMACTWVRMQHKPYKLPDELW